MVGSSERISHTNMTLLTDEEEEQWEENCQPGDIRVGFETEAMPIEVTIVAEQNDYRLMPMRENGEPNYILFDKRLQPEEVLSYYEERENLQLNWWRFVCGLLVFVGMICRWQDPWPFEVFQTIYTLVVEYASSSPSIQLCYSLPNDYHTRHSCISLWSEGYECLSHGSLYHSSLPSLLLPGYLMQIN